MQFGPNNDLVANEFANFGGRVRSSEANLSVAPLSASHNFGVESDRYISKVLKNIGRDASEKRHHAR